MTSYVYRRLVMIPLLLGAVSIIVFLLIALIPGDPALVLAGPDATANEVQAIRVAMGLDEPLPVRYVKWLGNVLQGNLGVSTETREPVRQLLVSRFLNTLMLAAAAMILAMIIGVAAGTISALSRNSLSDMLVTLAALFGNSMPTFWLGLVLIVFFSFQFGLLPSSGMYSVREQPTLVGLLSHLVLPAVTLAATPMAVITRVTRSAMLDVIHQEYISVARSKGLAELVIVHRHELKNAFLPVLTIVGLQFGYLLGGAVVTETIFSWPGIGSLMYHAVSARDFPLIQSGVLLVSTSFVLINLAVDVLYGQLDPRVRVSKV